MIYKSTKKSLSLALTVGFLGLIIGPLIYIQRFNPNLFSEILILISKNQKMIMYTSVEISIFYLIGYLFSKRDENKDENAIRDVGISIGLIVLVFFIITRLPSILLV